MTSGLVIAGFRFDLSDQHACAIIVLRDGFVNVMVMYGGCVIGWPFVETSPVPPLLVIGVGLPYVFTRGHVVTTSQNVAQFDPVRPLGS